MSLKARIVHSLNIEEGEEGPVLYLLIHSFFQGIVIPFYTTASNALFLQELSAEDLPWTYLLSPVFGYLVVSVGYGKVAKQASFTQMLRYNLAFLVAVLLVFCVGASFDLHWTFSIAILAFYRVIVSLIGMNSWGLAGRLFDLRQAKRLYSFIGTGAVVSSVAAFAVIPLLVKYLSVYALLWGTLITLVAWLFLMEATIRKFSSQLERGGARPSDKDSKKEQPVEKPLGLFETRYTTLIFVLSMLPMFGYYFVDYMFLAETQGKYSGEEIASFLAIFFGFGKFLDLFVKGIAGTLTNRYGIRIGIMALPVMLTVGTGVAALAGVLGPEGQILFFLVIFTKLIDKIFRISVNDPSFQILYQPIPEEQRTAFQSRIEGIPKQLGTALAAISLLVLGWMGIPTLQMLVIFLIILPGWIALAKLLYSEYVRMLQGILERQASDRASVSIFAVPTIDVLKTRLKEEYPDKIVNTLTFLKNLDPATMGSFLVELLDRPEKEVRIEALREIERNRLSLAAADVDRLIESESDPDVRDVALAAQKTLQRARDDAASVERIQELVASSDPEDRVYATVLLSQVDSAESRSTLIRLLRNPDLKVGVAAIVAAGRRGDPELWPHIIGFLGSPVLCHAAASALIEIGEPVVPDLVSTFDKMITEPTILVRIINVVGRIGGSEASRFLWSKINFPNNEVDRQVLIFLSLCGYTVTTEEERRVLKRRIDETVDNTAWCMSAIRDLGIGDAYRPLRQCLGKEIDRYRERVFLLLSLIYDNRAIALVRDQFMMASLSGRVFALELIDVLVPPELKAEILPLLEDTALTLRLRRLEARFPQAHLSQLERLKDIVNREYTKVDRWTKSAALDVLPDVSAGEISVELIANLFNPSTMLREVAANGIYRIDPEAYRKHALKLRKNEREALEVLVGRRPVNGIPPEGGALTFDKIRYMKSLEVFSDILEVVLAGLVPAFEEVWFAAGETFIEQGKSDTEIYIILEGDVKIHFGDEVIEHRVAHDVLGEMAYLTGALRSASCTAVRDTRCYRLSGEQFFEMLSDHIEMIGPVIVMLHDRLNQIEQKTFSAGTDPSGYVVSGGGLWDRGVPAA